MSALQQAPVTALVDEKLFLILKVGQNDSVKSGPIPGIRTHLIITNGIYSNHMLFAQPKFQTESFPIRQKQKSVQQISKCINFCFRNPQSTKNIWCHLQLHIMFGSHLALPGLHEALLKSGCEEVQVP